MGKNHLFKQSLLNICFFQINLSYRAVSFSQFKKKVLQVKLICFSFLFSCFILYYLIIINFTTSSSPWGVQIKPRLVSKWFDNQTKSKDLLGSTATVNCRLLDTWSVLWNSFWPKTSLSIKVLGISFVLMYCGIVFYPKLSLQ